VPTLRELIVGLMRLVSFSSLGWQLRERSFYVTPDAAQSDAEDSLPATEQVDHLVVRGALEDRHPVAHQRDLREVLHPARPQMLDRGTDLLQLMTGIDQPLDHLPDQDVAEAVEAL
jgi:hypothetical protein